MSTPLVERIARVRQVATPDPAAEAREAVAGELLEVLDASQTSTDDVREVLRIVARAYRLRLLYRDCSQGGSYNASKTHCPAGHAYDRVNTYRDRLGRRYCRACRRDRRVRRGSGGLAA